MQDSTAATHGAPLSEGERLLDTFVAPSKTFTDILRNTNWWVPCALMILLCAAYAFVVLHKVGIEIMAGNFIQTMPRIHTVIAKDPRSAALIQHEFENQILGRLYLAPVFLILGSFVGSALFLMTANFVFAGKAKYKELLAMFWYSQLPLLLPYCAVIVLLFCGVGIRTFSIDNPIGTNIGYYLSGTPAPLVAALSYIDVFSLWV
ncbi:MAG: YIP1 family protein, partial [Bryocella sp.]